MSNDTKRGLVDARTVADDFVEFVQDVSLTVLVAGSIRRQKAMVGDIEIVIEPVSKMALWNRLEMMLQAGTIKKALYGEKKLERWGETHRGLLFAGWKIEIFACDSDNRGYIQWLRTGSAEKNEYVVTRMKAEQYPVRFKDGYVWHVSYEKSHPMFEVDLGFARLNKLRVGDERGLYRLLGMPSMPANQRELRFYEPILFTTPIDELMLKGMYAGGQMMMF